MYILCIDRKKDRSNDGIIYIYIYIYIYNLYTHILTYVSMHNLLYQVKCNMSIQTLRAGQDGSLGIPDEEVVEEPEVLCAHLTNAKKLQGMQLVQCQCLGCKELLGTCMKFLVSVPGASGLPEAGIMLGLRRYLKE